jgi:hypothetical protein
MDDTAAFTVRDAIASGVSAGALRSGRFVAPFHGVRATFESTDARSRCHAYAARMAARAAFTSLTAARLWGIPLPAWIPDDHVHVAVPHGTPPPGGRGVAGSSFASDRVRIVELDGLRVLSPADTWATLATRLDFADLVAAGDYLVTPGFGRSRSLATVDDLRRVLERRFRGLVLARRALAAVRVGPLSRPESLTRVLATSGGVPEPVCNLRISPLVMLDLAWPQWRFGLDYQGSTHRSPTQHAKDVARADLVRAAGWHWMQATATDLFDHPFDLLGRLRVRLIERGAPVGRIDVRKVVTARR